MKTLLWDFDNTLAYREGMWSQTLFDLLQQNGYPAIPIERIHPLLATGFPWQAPELSHAEFFKGVPWWTHMTRHLSGVLAQLGLPQHDADQIAGQVRSRFLAPEKWHVYEDVFPCLAEAERRGYRSLIVSNHVPELPQLADALALTPHFIRVITSAAVGYEKPNPRIFQAALAGLEDTKDVVMIGDTYSADVVGSLNAGLKAVLVRKPNSMKYPIYCEDLRTLWELLP